MYSATHNSTRSLPHSSKAQLITGRILSGLAILMFLMDGIMKIVRPEQMYQASTQLGYPESQYVGIGILLLACTLLYIIPRTAVFGAIMLTAYLGGAVASQVRIESPAFSLAFPVIVAAIMWLGVYLREPRLHNVLPIRS